MLCLMNIFGAVKKRLTIVVLLLAVGLAGLLVLNRQSDEPSYQGKSFSYWFRQYCLAWAGASGGPADVTEALRQMGTNAVPYLVGALLNTNQDSSPRKFYQEFVDRLPSGLQERLPVLVSAQRRRDKAADALFYTKPPAPVLLPLLTNALQSPDVTARRHALWVLGGVGDGAGAAVPSLVKGLKDQDPHARIIAAQSLKFLGSEVTAAVPDRIDALGDPTTRWNSVSALGNAGPDASPAIPSLRQLMETTTNTWRPSIAAAIYKIDPSQSDAFTMLRNFLKQRDDPRLRAAAIHTLRDLGSAASNAIPDMLETLRDPNRDLWHAAYDALLKIAADPRVVVPVLLEKVANTSRTNQETRLNAAADVVRVDPTNLTAQAVLIQFVKSKSLFRGYAIEVLGEAGPGAKTALPVVKEALRDSDKSVRKSAADAIRKIEGKGIP